MPRNVRYRILEEQEPSGWTPFGIAYERGTRVMLFSPAWRASRSLSVDSLENLGEEHFPSSLSLFRWTGIRVSDHAIDHPIELLRYSIAAQYKRLRPQLPGKQLARLPRWAWIATILLLTIAITPGFYRLLHSWSHSGRDEQSVLIDTTGSRVIQTGPGRWSLPADRKLSPERFRQIDELLTEGKVRPLKKIRIAMVEVRSDIVNRGAADQSGPIPLSPLATAVRDRRPTFRWMPYKNTRSYRVFLATADETTVIWKGIAKTGDQITLPKNVPALLPGGTYSWQVEATGAEVKISCWVRFYVLNAAEAAEIGQIERQCDGSALALAAAYEEYGLYEEAARQIERLAPLNPKNSLPNRLMEALQEERSGRKSVAQ